MKKILIAAGIFLALVVAAGVSLPFFIDIDSIVAGQIPALEKQLHRDISIGDVRLTVLTGLGAEIRNVTVSDHPDFGKDHFVSIERFNVSLRLLPLLHKQVMISSVFLDKPSVRIGKNARGVFNFADMFPAGPPAEKTGEKPEPETTPGDPLAALKNIQISGISIKDGTFAFSDASGAGSPIEIKLDQFNLSLKGVSLTRKIDVELGTDIYSGPKAGHVSLSGNLGPVGTSLVPEIIPLDLSLSLKDLNLAHLATVVKGLETPSGAVTADVTVKGRLQDQLRCRTTIDWNKLEVTLRDTGKPAAPGERIVLNGPWEITSDLSGSMKTPALSGKIILDKCAMLFGNAFDKPAGSRLNMTFDLMTDGKNRKISIKSIAGAEPSDLSIDATVSDSGKPDIKVQVASSYLDVGVFLPPATPETKESGPKPPPMDEPESSRRPAKRDKIPDMRIEGDIALKKCKYDNMVIENIAARFLYADGVTTLNRLSLDTFGGNISADAVVDLTDMASPRWSTNLSTSKINANDALNQFTSVKDTFYGDVSSRLSLQGKGGDWPAISKSLTGGGSADIVNGKLVGVNVLDAVGESLLKFQGLSALALAVSPKAGQHLNETEFTQLAGKFNIREELIHLETMTMATADFNLSGNGTIGLDKKLNLDTVLVLSRDASGRFENDKTLRYFLNKDRQMEIPCAIKGDVSNPRVTADGDTLNRLMRNAATRAVEDQVQKGVEDKLGEKADQLLKRIFK